MPAMHSAEDMLTAELKSIHAAERQLTRKLPKLAKKASSARLKAMLDERLTQGAELMGEVENALGQLAGANGGNGKAKGKNLAAKGMLKETATHLGEIRDDRLVDPYLLASVQKVEHYCLASWGAAAAMARMLGQARLVQAMEKALDSGKRLDRQMTSLAEQEINVGMLDSDPLLH